MPDGDVNIDDGSLSKKDVGLRRKGKEGGKRRRPVS